MVVRLLKLWRLYATMDVLYVARDLQAAITFYVADLVLGISAATATFLLAERFDGIGGWTKPQVLFLLGYALLVRLLINTCFNYNLAHVSRRIGRGQLDHLFIQPQPLWMALVTEGFAPATGTGMLLPTIALFGAASQQLSIAVTPGWWALFVMYVLASIVVVQAFEYAWASLAFWAPRAAEEVNSHTWDLLQTLIPFPLDGVSGWMLTTLLTIVPAGLVAWSPSRVLLDLTPVTWPDAAVVPVAAILFAAFAFWIFTRGLHHYGYTGSSRYLEYGHRR
jgi:viologen exporter family transport system permease protein